jgi:hypothetical protein
MTTATARPAKLKNQTISVNQRANDLYFDQRLPTYAVSNVYGTCEIKRTVTPYPDEHAEANGLPRGWIASKYGKLIVQDWGHYWEIVGPLILCRAEI